MSTIRDPAIITAQGRQMMTAGGDISYTKAVLFGQDISHLTKEQLEGLTSIGNPLMTVTVGISDKSINNDGTTVSLEATFQNSGLKADLPYTAVGFFARKGDDTEKLVILGIANSGAYLAAASPDGVATDALDVKVAISIGDATSVTAVVDPAGSVTPAALNGAINKLDHDISAKIDANQDSTEKALDTKSDKATVESDLATKANQSDLDKTNAEVAKKADSENVTTQLDTKADKTDVASAVKQLQDSIATKADAKTVNDAISKIDFTPYAKSVDVYSKAELDKKLLALSTDTDGKVNADQVATMIEGKADKSDVASQIKTVTDLANTKADASDVYTKKTVDDAFSTRDGNITNAANLAKQAQATANTKANSSDVYTKADVDGKTSGTIITAYDIASKTPTKETNSYTNYWLVDQRVLSPFADQINQLKGRRTVDSADFNSLTDGGTYYISSPAKNAPVSQWGNLFVSNGNGHRVSQVYFPDDGNAPWYRVLDEQSWRDWVQLSTKADVNNAANSANAASNKVDTVLTNSYVRKQGMNQNGDLVEIKRTGIKQDNGGYAFDMWSDDWTASKLKDVLGQLPSKANSSDVSALQNKANISSNLFRQIQNSNNWNDIFGVDNPNNVLTSLRINAGGFGPLLDDYASGIGFGGADTKGVLSVAYQNHQARITGGNGAGPVWSEDVAWKSDINDLRNQVQQLRENQFETQTFTDANAAANWEAQKPGKRLAIVNR